MKIIYIANFRFPTEKAHGIQIAKMCEAFGESGVQLELVVPRLKGFENPFVFYGIKENFAVKRIWTINLFRNSYFGFLLSSFIFGIASFFYVSKKNVDAIYSMDLDPVSFIIIPFLKKPYFFDLHGPKTRNILNSILFKKISGIATINQKVEEEMKKNFAFLANKIIVCPNGVDLKEESKYDKKNSREKLGLNLNDKIAVYTGSFQDWKGIETILKASAVLEDISFYIVGGEKKEIEKFCRELILLENVKFMGWRDYKEMPFWRSSADVLLVTGTKKNEYSYFHTSPMKLFEYMGSRRPIVASKTPAISQVVDEEEVFFHEPDDAQSLASQIKFIFENKSLAQEKVEEAYKKAEFFSWENRAKKILEFIKNKI